MGQKHHKLEEIVAKLRQVEVLTAQDKPVADAVRATGVQIPQSKVVRTRCEL